MTAMLDEMRIDGPADVERTVALAHGAGAPMDSPFMQQVAEALAAADLRCVRFEFPYMAERRRSGRRPGPNAPKILLQHWRDVVAALAEIAAPGRLVIGGKSMGGRIASMVADELGVAGLVCLGYPFHPPGKLDRPRVAHLRELATPALIVQGERDSFGTPDEVEGYELSDAIEIVWLPDGDHSFKPRKRSGHTEADNLAAAVAAIAAFTGRVLGS